MNNKLLTYLTFLGIFLVGFVGTYLMLTLSSKGKANKSTKQATKENVIPGAPAVDGESNSYNVLLLGSGGEGHSGGALTDSIIVANINTTTKRVSLISIPRDLWVPGNYKINSSVVNVGLTNFKGTIQNITNLPISYVVSVDFDGIVEIINSLDEIEISLDKSYDDHFYPVRGLENETCGKTGPEIAELHAKYSGFELEKQFTCRYEHIHADSGKSKINGDLALKLARSRHGDSDFGRSIRQFAILKGILNKLISIDALEKIDELYSTFIRSIKTDISPEIVKDLAKVIGDPKGYQVNEVHITEENVLSSSKSAQGAYILIPKAGTNNFTEVKAFISTSINK